MNNERTLADVEPLEERADLHAVALARASEMAATGTFSHRSPSGWGMAELLDASGIFYGRAGENIARSDEPVGWLASAVHRSLMASAGHRAIILDVEFRAVGIGIARAGSVYYIAMIFID